MQVIVQILIPQPIKILFGFMDRSCLEVLKTQIKSLAPRQLWKWLPSNGLGPKMHKVRYFEGSFHI